MDDLISREAVKEMIKNHRVDFSTEKDYRTARACANAVPPAEPKRGYWKYNAKIGTFKVWTCDQCGWNSEAEFNFCPNCGAKMEVTE